MDAPIGYIASLENLAKSNKSINTTDYLSPDTKTELYHFIGKDIIEIA